RYINLSFNHFGDFYRIIVEETDEEYAYAIVKKEVLATRSKLLLNHVADIDSIFKQVEDEALYLLKYKLKE
ncbi:hypothetical protein, partial [Duncaniella muris]|uniref:hypothetical protein n=1 Tax=Duncaniella muris TaxID=2094150 RepID=UPI00272D2D17